MIWNICEIFVGIVFPNSEKVSFNNFGTSGFVDDLSFLSYFFLEINKVKGIIYMYVSRIFSVLKDVKLKIRD